ncbi:hypothetical protein TNCV_4222921 [Trichonephila clavipes]|nr:hypothetical protein TNCV_4222921 [Trichonephila clavipes]
MKETFLPLKKVNTTHKVRNESKRKGQWPNHAIIFFLRLPVVSPGNGSPKNKNKESEKSKKVRENPSRTKTGKVKTEGGWVGALEIDGDTT